VEITKIGGVILHTFSIIVARHKGYFTEAPGTLRILFLNQHPK